MLQSNVYAVGRLSCPVVVQGLLTVLVVSHYYKLLVFLHVRS